MDLRSSTEELDFHDPDELKKKGKVRSQSPSLHDDPQQHQRKDSQSSEIGLLCISGRTSRLSSIGSQGSGQSRLSNASHLSVISGQSGLSRSPSPHKLMLETSFCGYKSPEAIQKEQLGTKLESDMLEKIILARKHDPTKVILAEGISIKDKPPEKPIRKSENSSLQNVRSDITIKVEEAASLSNNTPKFPKKIISKSGVEYIYIPLKGPLPIDDDAATLVKKETRIRETRSAPSTTKHKAVPIEKAKSTTPSPSAHKREGEPKYIRIRLKPDYMYSQEDDTSHIKPQHLDLDESHLKVMDNLDAISVDKDERPLTPGKSLTTTPSASPKLSRHGIVKDIGSKTPSPSLSRKSSFASIFRSKETIISPESPTAPGCRRKNTLSSLLREAGDSLRDRSRSRSKSRDRDRSGNLSAAPSSTESIDSKTKQKSVFSIFKPKKGDKAKSDLDTSSSEVLPSIDGIAKVEFKFKDSSNKTTPKKYYETPLEGDSIRIPLHSPTHYEDHSILQDLKTSSQDSQDTVIEVASKSVETVVEIVTDRESNVITVDSSKEFTSRQSSTSSENIVFSTKLGSNNEIFTTKLPKENPLRKSTKPEVPVSETVNGHIPILEETKEEEIKKPEATPTVSSVTSSVPDEEPLSSESEERDSEADVTKIKKDSLDLKLDLEFLEPERKGLVLQQDSYDDELPYIPTTLPQERFAAVPILPIKQRSTFEMKTCPIERPRSTTPINPSCLEEYCEEVMGDFNSENVTKTIEKLKISLPRHDSIDKSIKSPRKVGSTATVTTNWFEFAEKGISTGRRSSLTQECDTPPPLPPKGTQKEWINFEEIPEKRKPPKKIQTLPSRGHIDVPDSVLQDNVVYNYVNPEECKCECHEMSREKREKEESGIQEDELPLLEDENADDDKVDRIKLDVVSDRRSVVRYNFIDTM